MAEALPLSEAEPRVPDALVLPQVSIEKSQAVKVAKCEAEMNEMLDVQRARLGQPASRPRPANVIQIEPYHG